MKTNLFDKNGIEIQVGDKYTVGGSDTYNVYFKCGCVCGGLTEDTCSPLTWHYDANDNELLSCNEDCSWLEIITTNRA